MGTKTHCRNETIVELCTKLEESLNAPGKGICKINDLERYITTDDQRLEVWIKVNATNIVGNYTTEVIKFIVSENGNTLPTLVLTLIN